MQGSSLELPTGYYLERDPDLLILRRLDGAMVGAFSARGALPEAVRQTAVETIEEDDQWQPPADHSHTPTIGSNGSSGALPTPPSTLRVRFFGHFEMLCDEEIITLGRNGKALSILKYLLAHRCRPVSQDHLMGWLWPHSNLKKARWSLNSAIHTLRKLLSECGGSSSSSSSSGGSGGGGASSSGSSSSYVVVVEGDYSRFCSEEQIL